MNKERVVLEEHSTIGFGHNPNAEQTPNNRRFQDCYGCSGVRICPSFMQVLLQYLRTHSCALPGTNASTILGIRNVSFYTTPRSELVQVPALLCFKPLSHLSNPSVNSCLQAFFTMASTESHVYLITGANRGV